MRQVILILWIELFAIFFSIFVANAAVHEFRASVRIPLHHWSYDVLERLATEGLVDRMMIGHKPLRRRDVARTVLNLSTIKDEISKGNSVLVRNLEREFRVEIEGIRAEKESFLGEFHIRPQFTVGGWTRDFVNNLDSYRLFDFQEGTNLGLEIPLGLNIGDRTSIFLSPYVLWNEDTTEARLRTAYVDVDLWGMDIEVGIDELWWGPGYHGDFVITDNADPFFLGRVSRMFEEIRATVVVGAVKTAQEGRGDVNATLGGMRVEWSYRNRLFLEASLGSVFGGGSANQVGEFGGAWYVANGVKIYAISGGDDLWESGVKRRSFPWGKKNGRISGIYLSDPLQDGKTDFRVELAVLEELEGREDNWYFERGRDYFHKGSILGHHLGRRGIGGTRRRNERDFFLKIGHQLSSDLRVEAQYNRESSDVSVTQPIEIEFREFISFLSLDVMYQSSRKVNLYFAGRFFPVLRQVLQTGAVDVDQKDFMYTITAEYMLF